MVPGHGGHPVTAQHRSGGCGTPQLVRLLGGPAQGRGHFGRDFGVFFWIWAEDSREKHHEDFWTFGFSEASLVFFLVIGSAFPCFGASEA